MMGRWEGVGNKGKVAWVDKNCGNLEIQDGW